MLLIGPVTDVFGKWLYPPKWRKLTQTTHNNLQTPHQILQVY